MSGDGGDPAGGPVRRPAVDGSFYPASTAALSTLVRDLVADAARLATDGSEAAGTPSGLLVPHAGLVYSGATAATAWRLLEGAEDTTVVLLGTNHTARWLDGVGAWPDGAWSTPLGDVAVDAPLGDAIVRLGAPFATDREAHAAEHSIEVQLPLLRSLAPDARIVPLAIATGRGRNAVIAGTRLGELLADRVAGGARVVLAISTDMAHYPDDGAARWVTDALLPVLATLDAAGLATAEHEVCERAIPGLACGMCGIEPAILGLAALRAMGATHGTRLAATTSADAGAPRDRVVGYLAMRFDRAKG